MPLPHLLPHQIPRAHIGRRRVYPGPLGVETTSKTWSNSGPRRWTWPNNWMILSNARQPKAIGSCFWVARLGQPQEASIRASRVPPFPSRCQETAARCAWPGADRARTRAFSAATCLSVCARTNTAPGERRWLRGRTVWPGMSGMWPQPQVGEDLLNDVGLAPPAQVFTEPFP